VAGDQQRAYDTYLVASARIGDREAWRRLVERWQPRFLVHAWRLTGDADLAAEASQEAWVEVLRGIARLEEARAFPAWSLRILTRRCARLIRGRQRHRDAVGVLAVEPELGFDCPSDGEVLIDLTAVQRALETLSDEQRAVMGLFYLEEMSVAEVSVVLGIPPGTVKTRLMHARRKLQHKLEGEDDAQHRRADQ
jgi:RNA polymerase sigma-70 factor (ECF subfamily)